MIFGQWETFICVLCFVFWVCFVFVLKVEYLSYSFCLQLNIEVSPGGRVDRAHERDHHKRFRRLTSPQVENMQNLVHHSTGLIHYSHALPSHTWYLSFFLHWQNFWEKKFTPKMPIFCVKSVKIYTGQKNLHWRRQPRQRQLSGMDIYQDIWIYYILAFCVAHA